MLKRDLCLYNRLRFAYLVATFSGKAPLNRNRTFLSGNHTLQFSCSSLDMFYSDRKKKPAMFLWVVVSIWQEIHLLHAHLLWHDNDATVAFHCSSQSESDTLRNKRKKQIWVALSAQAFVYFFTPAQAHAGDYQCFQRWALWWCLLAWGSRLSQRPPPSADWFCPWHCRPHWRTRTWPLHQKKCHNNILKITGAKWNN